MLYLTIPRYQTQILNMKAMIKFNVNFMMRTLVVMCSFLMFAAQYGSAQVFIEQSGADLSELDVTEYDKELIIKTMNTVVNAYANNATFLSESGQFSDEKYAEFLGMFSGGARIFNDVIKKDGGNVDYAVYADNIYQYMQGTGVKFELNDIYLDKIRYDSGGFYVVTLSMEKLMLNGLNSNNVPVNYSNGIPFPITMEIEMPDYDIEQGTIISILGEEKKMKVERASMITVDGFYSSGLVLKSNNTSFTGFEEDKEFPVSYNGYGVEALYKLSLDNDRKFWAVIGAQVGFHNYKVGLDNFDGSEKLDDKIQVGIGGDTYYKLKEIVNEDKETITSFVVAPGTTFEEKLSVTAIEIPLGISYNMISTYDYDFSIDLTVNPYYSISSSGKLTSDGNVTTYKIPSDTLTFPTALVKELFEPQNANILNQYYTGFNGELNEITGTSNQFSLGVMLAPNFHYKFNYRLALELGANIQYNFLPMFNGEHLSGKANQSLINYTKNEETVYTSTLQHYFKGVNLFRYGLKAGIVFKFK